MGKTNPNQASFSGGEFSPMLYGRGEDYERYGTAVKTLKNMVCLPAGPATCRPGFRYIEDPKDTTKECGLIPFEFSDTQAYGLEVGDYYIRFYRDGARIDKAAANTPYWFDEDAGIAAWSQPVAYYLGQIVSRTIDAWVTATAYIVGDIRRTDTDVYYCYHAHTSSAAGAVGDEPGVGADWEDEWVLATEDGNDARFVCKLEHTSAATDEPGDSANWETYWTLIYDHFESTDYAVGDYVWEPLSTTNNHPYVCIFAHTSSHEKNNDMPGHGVSWISLGYFVRADFGHYAVGDFVKIGAASTDVYRCIHAHDSVEADDYPGTGTTWDTEWVQDDTYEIATPYPESEVSAIQFAQSADTIYITHANHHPQKMKRIQHDYWTFYSFACAVPVDEDITKEGDFQLSIKVANKSAWPWANVGLTGKTGTGFSSNTEITEGDVGKYIVRNGIRPAHAGIFHITHYLGSGEVWGEVTEAWTAYPGPWVTATDYAEGYTLLHDNDVYLCIDTHTSAGATEPGTGGSWTDVWEVLTGGAFDWHWQDDFDQYGGNPAAITFQDDRMMLASTSGAPTDLFTSKAGIYNDFTASATVVASDGLRLTLLSRKVQVISWLQAHHKLLVGTVEAEWLVSSATGDGPITALSKQARVGSYHGSARGQMPVEAENAILHIQRHGKTVWEIYWNSELDGYIGEDLMILADHLTRNHTIVDIAYQKEPHKVLWAVRSDGALLGLTYHHEQKVAGWHQHIFGNGSHFVESIMVLPGTEGDDLWAVVKRRTAVDAYTREIVRMDPFFKDAETVDAFFLDSGLTYDGRQEIESIDDVTLVVTVTGHNLSNGDEIRFRVEDDPMDTVGANGSLNQKIFEVSDKDADTFKCKDADGNYVDFATYTAPNLTHGTAANNTIAKMVTTASGLDHLEGETVQVVGDGLPLDDATVASGAITLSQAASVVHAGLEYTCDLETLPPAIPLQSGSSQGETKQVNGVVIRVFESLGFKVGPHEDDLIEVPVTDDTGPYNQEVPLFSGEKDVAIDDVHETEPTILIRQDQPLPLTILGITKQLEIS